MKNRFLKWLLHLYWKYTASSKQISNLEAKRYCDYLTENYNEIEQLFILKELHKCLIEYRENQIKNTDIEIIEKKDTISVLNDNLDKLKLYREA